MRITLLTLQSQINKLRGEGNKALRGKAEYQTENVSSVIIHIVLNSYSLPFVNVNFISLIFDSGSFLFFNCYEIQGLQLVLGLKNEHHYKILTMSLFTPQRLSSGYAIKHHSKLTQSILLHCT